ncbi:Helix-turn-helix domain-containing protein [Azospirillaceae bacterium]
MAGSSGSNSSSPHRKFLATPLATHWQPSNIMHSDSAAESDMPKKRGRIPQSAWPRILERHKAGVTLSALAREFDCTPSAISYIVRKAEAASRISNSRDYSNRESVRDENASVAPKPSSAPAISTPSPALGSVSRYTLAPRAPSTLVKQPSAGTENLATSSNTSPTSSASLHSAPLSKNTTTPGSAVALPLPTPPTNAGTAASVVVPTNAAPQPQQPTSAPSASPVAADGALLTTTNPAPTPVDAPSSRPSAAPPPIDAIEARLRETARNCLAAYRGWRLTPGETSIQVLNDAVHDLRKTLARIGFDISAIRRDEQGIRPIPIPIHRAVRRPR